MSENIQSRVSSYSPLEYNIIKHLKFIIRQIGIRKITKNFLINYYNLTHEESLIIIKMLHGTLVSKRDIIKIAEKIFKEDLLNLISQYFYDVTLIIYVDDYKINLDQYVARDVTNYSKYANWPLRNNTRTVKKSSSSRTN